MQMAVVHSCLCTPEALCRSCQASESPMAPAVGLSSCLGTEQRPLVSLKCLSWEPGITSRQTPPSTSSSLILLLLLDRLPPVTRETGCQGNRVQVASPKSCCAPRELLPGPAPGARPATVPFLGSVFSFPISTCASFCYLCRPLAQGNKMNEDPIHIGAV